MSWIPYILYKFLKLPFEKIDRHRISFTILPQEEIVVVRPTTIDFNHEFIFNYMYCRRTEYPENYVFQYRIPRTEQSIRLFITFVHTRILKAMEHPDHRLWQNKKEEYVSLLPKQESILKLQQWAISMNFLKIDTQKRATLPDYEKNITFFLSHIDSYAPFQSSVQLTGCTQREILRCLSTKNQILYLLGEHHEMNGNFMECLQTILQNTKCPVDIILETTYDWSDARSSYGPFFSNKRDPNKRSNGGFLIQTFSDCLLKGKVPKQTQIVSESTYFKKCIAPFKGRVKLWSEDYRFHDRFIFLNLLEIDLPDPNYMREKYRLIHSFYDRFCNSHTFNHQYEIYYQQLEAILKEIETFVRRQFPGLRFKIPPQPKGLKKLLESIRYFHPDVIQYWFHLISEHSLMQKEFFTFLFDIPATLRILRLFHTKQDRIIFTLCGTFHVNNIVDLLRKKIQNHSSDDFEYRFYNINIPSYEGEVRILPYPLLQSNDTTPRIQSYQRHISSKLPRKKVLKK